MGIKFARDYNEIIDELTPEILRINNFYEFFDMSESDWGELDKEEQKECAKTLADDIFFGLNEEAEISLGDGAVKYDKSKNSIEVFENDVLLKHISLI
jgi:hypothetical protein